MESVYSQRIRAGKRRTYFFDVRETRGNDYYLTITESRKRFDSDGYDRHKIFLYKEDFNKFIKGLAEAVDYVKTELMPDFDFDAYNHDTPEGEGGNSPESNNSGYTGHSNHTSHAPASEEPVSDEIDEPASRPAPPPPVHTPIVTTHTSSAAGEEVDKW